MIWDYFFDGQIPSKEPSRFVQARTSAPHEVDIRKSPGVGKPHITLESYMEAKAKQLGGAPFRKIFFKYLGWARAQVNILYPCCGSQMRSYLSDNMPLLKGLDGMRLERALLRLSKTGSAHSY
ncbi:hypothetical protein BGZ60DRAFT_422277 [Tricladium varicosporioides]|nr:hypothetical protein BGZ60DRAFT_422277 [Hymenoscyphus varicosporioides]